MAAGKPKREKWPRIILLVPATDGMSALEHLFIRDAKGLCIRPPVYVPAARVHGTYEQFYRTGDPIPCNTPQGSRPDWKHGEDGKVRHPAYLHPDMAKAKTEFLSGNGSHPTDTCLSHAEPKRVRLDLRLTLYGLAIGTTANVRRGKQCNPGVAIHVFPVRKYRLRQKPSRLERRGVRHRC